MQNFKPESNLPAAKPIIFEQLIKIIKKSQPILIVAGQPIDGDSLPAALALRRVFIKLKNPCDIATGAKIPEHLQFLPDLKEILTKPDFSKYKTIIILDCGELKQTGYLDQIMTLIKNPNLAHVINIDHHIQHPVYGNYAIIDNQAAATGVIIYRFIQYWQKEQPEQLIDQQIATLLLTTLYNDTGSFQNANTNIESLRMAADLIRAGASAHQIATQLYRNKPLKVLRLWGRVLERFEFQKETNMVVSYITLKDLQELQLNPDETKGIVSVLNHIPESRFSLLLTEEEPNIIKGSLRSEEEKSTDVSRIARLMGGGGHRLASGFKIIGHLEEQAGRFRVV